MTDTALAESSGSRRADRIIRGVVDAFEVAFPGRVRAYYLIGSRADGTALPASDIDLLVLFAGPFASAAEPAAALRLRRACQALSPLPLDLPVRSEAQLAGDDHLELVVNLRLASRLVYGRDVRDHLSVPTTDRYRRWAVRSRLQALAAARGLAGGLRLPLDHPDPTGPVLGYDRWAVATAEGGRRPTTKFLVNNVGWTAAALVALRAAVLVPSKRECRRLYREQIGDGWADLIDEVEDACRDRWRYRVPTDRARRQQLRALCERALAFDQHFLATARAWLVALAEGGPPQEGRWAQEQLTQLFAMDEFG